MATIAFVRDGLTDALGMERYFLDSLNSAGHSPRFFIILFFYSYPQRAEAPYLVRVQSNRIQPRSEIRAALVRDDITNSPVEGRAGVRNLWNSNSHVYRYFIFPFLFIRIYLS